MFAAPPITGYHVATHRLAMLSLSLSLLPTTTALTQRRKGKAFHLNILIRFVINCKITIQPGMCLSDVLAPSFVKTPGNRGHCSAGVSIHLLLPPLRKKRKLKYAYLCRLSRQKKKEIMCEK